MRLDEGTDLRGMARDDVHRRVEAVPVRDDLSTVHRCDRERVLHVPATAEVLSCGYRDGGAATQLDKGVEQRRSNRLLEPAKTVLLHAVRPHRGVREILPLDASRDTPAELFELVE